MEINASAPVESFFTLPAPFADGFRKEVLEQSWAGEVNVKVWKREWWKWREMGTKRFERAAVEFAGDYLHENGTT